MPTQENINEIASFLSKFWTGELEHRQEWYHCGTAHCLAGWKAVHDAQKAGMDVEKKRENYASLLPNGEYTSDWFQLPALKEFIGGVYPVYANEWNYASLSWGLEEEDADLLFEGHLELDEMIDNLHLIAHRYNLTVPEIPSCHDSE